MNIKMDYDAMFSGIIGEDYAMLKQLSPLSYEMSSLVGATVAEYAKSASNVVELGGGTGITTLSILSQHGSAQILSIDNEPTMQKQAQESLAAWVNAGRLTFSSDDALTALKKLPDASVDSVASAYTLHNFTQDYRKQVLAEVFRVLVPGGCFINGDRYALDDIDVHTRTTQQEVSRYFSVLIAAGKLELLEHWIVHLFSDESENHIMRETQALTQLADAGFSAIQLSHRYEVNALVSAYKPQ
ncbi:class I SAM-dependent methyltransferase [Methylocucumis oryzae]|uniref:Ubiquinone biosynthesis protein UbiE n=1 Tax=Methylocucumis oryzae TaxID=1632867 RepID=A0A0F3IF65_9GAMM|nr:class I SAM-dependent methyltransferase [Methylocucumis oryzae]KJV05465.1 ubiquinone biosynthesis protein UbiE [Methylocucumis oryzae]